MTRDGFESRSFWLTVFCPLDQDAPFDTRWQHCCVL